MQFEPSSSSGPAGADAPARVLVDAHVHLHPCFDLSESFRCASRNFASAASGEAFAGLLLLWPFVQAQDFRRSTIWAPRRMS